MLFFFFFYFKHNSIELWDRSPDKTVFLFCFFLKIHPNQIVMGQLMRF